MFPGLQRSRRRCEERQEDAKKNKKRKIRRMRSWKYNGMDDGRKRRRILKHADRRSRSKEDRVERDVKKRRNSKAESMSAE